jgi:glycosyltransferase involved in cell wall biosynthesis
MTQAGGRLRIAVLNRTFSPTAGGAERYSIALVEHLAARHEFHVFAQTIEHQWPGVTYHRVSMPLRKPRWINQLWFSSATWWATGRSLGRGFDIIHSHENTWHGDVQTVHVLPVRYTLFSGRTGVKLALRWFKVLTSPRLLAYLWLEKMRYSVRRGRAVVAISPSLQKVFTQTYPEAAEMTALITPGIDLPAMPISAFMREEARRQLGLPQSRFCVLFIGNDPRKKGLGKLIEAMRYLPDEAILAVVGDSAQLPFFRQQAEQAGLAARVFFLGSLADISSAYRAADCLAHPTLEDTFAMVVLEAMTHALPVVVTSVAYCGVSGLLHDGIDAFILDDPHDEMALGSALSRLLDDGTLRVEVGGRARTFSQSFQWGHIAVQQDELYGVVRAAMRPSSDEAANLK